MLSQHLLLVMAVAWILYMDLELALMDPSLQGNIFGWATAALMSGFKGVWSGRKSMGTSSPLSRPQLALGECLPAHLLLHLLVCD